jgi:hypothetical protein
MFGWRRLGPMCTRRGVSEMASGAAVYLNDGLLRALEAKWHEQRAPIAALLRPGLGDVEMDRLTTTLEVVLPEEARVLYRWHDGAARKARGSAGRSLGRVGHFCRLSRPSIWRARPARSCGTAKGERRIGDAVSCRLTSPRCLPSWTVGSIRTGPSRFARTYSMTPALRRRGSRHSESSSRCGCAPSIAAGGDGKTSGDVGDTTSTFSAILGQSISFSPATTSNGRVGRPRASGRWLAAALR